MVKYLAGDVNCTRYVFSLDTSGKTDSGEIVYPIPM